MDSKKGDQNYNNEYEFVGFKDDPIRSMEELMLEAVGDTVVKKENLAEIVRNLKKILSDELEWARVVDCCGLGLLKITGKGDNMSFVFESYPEDNSGGSEVSLIERIDGDSVHLKNAVSTTVTFPFPIENVVDSLAKKRGIPVDLLKHRFVEQLDVALYRMYETGKGWMPDFGVITMTWETDEFTFEAFQDMEKQIKLMTTSFFYSCSVSGS